MTAPTVTATSILARPMSLCAELLASSATWQAHLDEVHGDVDTAVKAQRHIYYPWASDETNEGGQMMFPRSRAVVNPSITYCLANTGSMQWHDHGDVLLSFEAKPPVGVYNTPEDEMIWFLNMVGATLREMAMNSGVSINPSTVTYLNAYEFNLIDGPAECVLADEGGEHFFGATFRVMWKG